MSNKLAFISYRRDDEALAARFIKSELERYFEPGQIFMDVDDIRVGNDWQEKIEENLKKADVLLVAIGKNWLKVQDENFRRRIDNDDDWVRKEIQFALDNGIKIFPLLLDCKQPGKAALPQSIQGLPTSQSLSMTPVHWREDMFALIDELKKLDFSPNHPEIVYPVPIAGMLFPLPFTREQLSKKLDVLPNWKIVDYTSKGKIPKTGYAIEKVYTFKSFEQVIKYMGIVADRISALKIVHHPEWENIFRTLRICLSTWDIGYQVSNLDIDLAIIMEEEFKKLKKEKRSSDILKL